MSKRTRRNHSPGFKAKVALAAMKDDKMIVEIARIAVCIADTFGPRRQVAVGQRPTSRQIPAGHAAQALTATIGNGVDRSFEEIDQLKQRSRRQALLRHR